ncbi:putative peptide transporter ptr2 [Psilocybe cubensis]|uniref:Peptide transporter ptr2 n=2 Tax=Psilocybe cubensis TaxID=181762 RepID=A0ACB8GR75_PSICU|nr:putative peptide transporter ptr2 [Psilocybe cubensis]KAH9478248.1 putative peptide transporter ptr2 [Psilocybe cubensis]
MSTALEKHRAMTENRMNEKFPSSSNESERPADALEYELDGIHDGLVFPTEEERATLRRVPDTIPWSSYLIAFVEGAERFSFYGSSVVFTNFIQRSLPPGSKTGAGGLHGQAGALGKGQRASTGLTTFFLFWCYVTPLIGAYIADGHWGRFKTIWVAVFIAFIGHIVLIVSALPGVIETNGAIGAFIVAIITIGLGAGMFKANIAPLVAEQYKRTKLFVVTTSSGERVVVDPSLTVLRIYMYYYLMINVGALIGSIAMPYAEKFIGFYLAFTLPTAIFLICPIVLYVSRNKYTRSPPTTSVLGTSIRLWRHAARGKWTLNPIQLYKNFNAPGFWENAKPSKQIGEKPTWMVFDDLWVDEVRRGVKACSVFLWYPIYWLAYNQFSGNLTSQAATMTLHGIPNDVVLNLDPLVLIVCIVLCDLFIYPALRRMGINFSALKKITAGFMAGGAGMLWAAVVQHYIYKTNPCGNHASECDGVSPLSVWIQSGSYVFLAISEVLASITGLEYAFTKAPKNMRSLVMSVFLFMTAISSALSEAFVSLSGDPLLVWNYGVISVMIFVTGSLFWWSVRDLDAKEDELNNIPEGHMGAPINEASKQNA